MAIEQFDPVFRPINNPVDLNTLEKAYDTLEQGHQQTIAMGSAIEQSLAELDLNEAEDDWRREQVNKIQTAIDDNSKYGNAYSALSSVIKTQGSIMSDQGMIGRLRAQQDYKQYIDKLEKRNDIPEEYKIAFKEMNQYNYKDVFDDNGNIIGGTKWKPNKEEVSTVPLNQMLNDAIRWAAKESGGGNTVRFLDANGNITENPTQSVTGEYFSDSSRKWERLSKEKLSEGVKAIIESTPGAKASLNQDYEMARWKYDKNGGNNPDITDKNGLLLSPEEYLAKRIDPFYNAATYYNQVSDIKYGNAWRAQLSMVGSQVDDVKETIDTLTTKTNPIKINNFVPTKAQADITSSKQTIANLIKAFNPNTDFNLDNATTEEIEQLIYTNVTDPVGRINALQNLDLMNESQEYLNSLREGKDADSVKGFDTYNAIISMSDLPNIEPNELGETNEYSERYSKLVNNIFGDGKAIRQYFADDSLLELFINEIGGSDKMSALGINVGSKDGKSYVELPKDYNKSLYSFAQASKKAHNSRSLFGQNWQRMKSKISGNLGDNVSKINNDGTETNLLKHNNTGDFQRSGNTQPNAVYSPLLNYVSTLKKKNDNVLDGGNLTLGQNVITEPTPNIAKIAFQMKANPTEASKLSSVYKLEQEELKRGLRGGLDLVQTGAYKVNNDGTFEEIDTQERKALTEYIRSVNNDKDIIVNAIADPKTGNISPHITILGKSEDGKVKVKPVTIIAPSGFDSNIVEEWNRNTSIKATHDINLYHGAQRSINITNRTAFAGIEKLTMIPNGDGWEVKDTSYNRNLGYVNNQQAIDIRDAYYIWTETYNAVKSGITGIPKERIVNNAEKAAKVITDLTVDKNNENYEYVLDYTIKQLLSNLEY